MVETVAMIGLGRIAEHHLRALEPLESIEIVAAADTDDTRRLHFRGQDLSVWTSVNELFTAVSPSTIIVATPTMTHDEVCRSVLASRSVRRLIVEKPLTDSFQATQDLFAQAAQQNIEVACVYHAAHAPEVLWAASRIRDWEAAHGSIQTLAMSFADRYRDMPSERRSKVYVNSWLDSGINALSIALRIVSLERVDRVVCLDVPGSTYRTAVSFRNSEDCPETGSITTSWDVDEADKRSELTFGSGARLRMNHQGISGELISKGGEIMEQFEYNGSRPRLTLHYDNAFTSLMVDHAGYYSAEESLLLHRLLFSQ